MTPAEKRIKELIDRWLTSLDLHLQYVELNDSAYNKVQPWPVHDRPTRWVLDVAKQKVLELQTLNESRLAMGDAKFADALELMMFLANMVGIQHVQRFIPIANPDHHGHGTLTELDGLRPVAPPAKSLATSASMTSSDATVAMPRPSSTPTPTVTHAPPPPKPQAAPVAPATLTVPVLAAEAVASQATVQMPRPPIRPPPADDSTREMPRPQAIAPAAASHPAPTLQKAVAKAPIAAKKPVATTPAKGGPLTEIHKLVIEDAVRLLNWGRPWHELAELVARIADRPKVNEVRRILRAHRPTIETRAADLESQQEEKKK